MAGLFRNDPTTRSTSTTRGGKYPVLLRRDGTVPAWEFFVLGARDPAAITAIQHYADDAKALGWDPVYVADLYAMAESWRIEQGLESERRARWNAARSADEAAAIDGWFPEGKPADPDGARHRTDSPDVLTFPGSLSAYADQVAARTAKEVTTMLVNAIFEEAERQGPKAPVASVVMRVLERLPVSPLSSKD